MSAEQRDEQACGDSAGQGAERIDAAHREAETPGVGLPPGAPGQPERVAATDGTLNSVTLESPGASPAAFAGPAPDSFAGYQILKELHRGGQGVVYQAIQKSTKRKVAIKVLKEGPFASHGDKARFEREVEILGQFNHPNIVAVHDSGEAAGGFYFAMDYISGQALAELPRPEDWDAIRYVALSSSGARAITSYGYREAIVWNADTGEKVSVLRGPDSQLDHAVFDPHDAKAVAVWGDLVNVYDTSSGRMLATLGGHAGRINSTHFSPDGTRVITASADRTARLWDAMTGQELVRLQDSEEVVFAGVSSDNTQVVTGASDGSVAIWDAATAQKVATLLGHRHAVNAAAFTLDGTRVVTGSWDETVRVWDARTGTALLVLGARGEVRTIMFDPPGERILASLDGGFVDSWDSVRYARRYAQRQARQQAVPRARSLVEDLRPRFAGWDEVAAAIRADNSLDAAVRGQALNFVLQRSSVELETKRQAAAQLARASARRDLDEAWRAEVAREVQTIPDKRTAVANLRFSCPADDPELVDRLSDLGWALTHTGNPDDAAEAEQYLRDAAMQREWSPGPNDPVTLGTWHNLGDALAIQGKLAEAEQVFTDTLKRKRAVFAPTDPEVLLTVVRLAETIVAESKLPDAEPLLDEIAKYDLANLDQHQPYIGEHVRALAKQLADRGQADRSQAERAAALERLAREILGE